MGFCFFGSAVTGRGTRWRRTGSSGWRSSTGTCTTARHQDLVWDDPRILFASTHQMPLYPGTGAVEERGAHGQVVNVPLPPGAGGGVFRAGMLGRVLPAVEAHRAADDPDLGGLRCARADPLADLNLVEADFAWATASSARSPTGCCDGRIVWTLEGGYDLSALAASVAAHVRVLMEHGHG